MAASQDREVNDNTVSLNVESEFIFDPGVPFNEIDVTTQDGIVTLKGKTDNLLAKERATLVAETVKGVRSVVNLVKVKPTKGLTGATLAKRIDSALLSDPAADSYEVDVTADDHGRVTLTGTVDSWQEKNLAGIVAKSVTGVTELRNDLKIDYKTRPPRLGNRGRGQEVHALGHAG